MTDAYREAVDFLFGRLNYERTPMPRAGAELRLGRLRRLLRRLGDPQDALRIIHVTGTKGKGSTATMLAAALTASGVRTGLFCSPHLHRVEERFRVDAREATPEELVALVEAIRPAVTTIEAAGSTRGERGLTFFEVTTAMGLLHFARERTGAVVLEVGMGGRLDSTNVVRPELAIITSISFDHTRQLGNTLGAIAFEKAGILKRDTPAISGVLADEPREVIRRVARQRRVRLRELDRDFGFDFHAPTPPLERPEAGAVSVRTWRSRWGPIPLPLPGRHQALNASIVMAAFDELADRGLEVTSDDVARGFAELRFPARFEVLAESPWLIVDAAHNVASAEALATTLLTCAPDVPRTLVFGTTRDKDMPGQLRNLAPLFRCCVATRYTENPRSVDPEAVAAEARCYPHLNVVVSETPADALRAARELTPPRGLICVAGSLFLAAETRALLLGVSSGAETRSLAAP